MRRRRNRREEKDSPSFSEYIKVRAKIQTTLGKHATAELYSVAGRHWARFLQGRPCRLCDVNATLVADFTDYLRARDLRTNTINSYLSSLRAVYNAAVGEGLVDGEPNPFAGLRLKREITAKRAVPASVVEEMARLDLNDNPEWQRAVDLALFAFCAFGMPFVDVVCLRKSDIRDGEIVYRRRKTSAEIRIGVTPAMKALFRRYANNTPYVFPLEQEAIERQGYAAYKLLLAKHNRALARVSEQVGATTRLTSYVMRHTWASEALANDVSVAIISQALGHSSEQTTRCYLKQLDRSALDEANDRVTGFLNKYIG